MTASMMHDMILAWLTAFAVQREFTREDLHLDQISAEFGDRRTWADAAVQCLTCASRIARVEKLPVTVAMELFLKAEGAAGVAPGSQIDDLAFSWTPPALTVYRKGTEPWTKNAAFQPVSGGFGLPIDEKIRVLFQEWLDESEGNFDRRLWFVAE